MSRLEVKAVEGGPAAGSAPAHATDELDAVEVPSIEVMAAFADALHHVEEGREQEALGLLRGLDTADARFLRGLLLVDGALETAELEEAAVALEAALDGAEGLGRLFGLVDWECGFSVAVEAGRTEPIQADRLGAALVLAEALQRLGRAQEAIGRLRALPERDDPRVKASIADLKRGEGFEARGSPLPSRAPGAG
jgi:hypothetical protein